MPARGAASQSGTDARMNTPADFRPEDLTAQEVRLSLRYAAPLNIVYANNPKCACSTIKTSLWKKMDQLAGTETFHPSRVHSQAPFLNTAKMEPAQFQEFLSATTFSVVRNPFRRALSAYLDKVGADRKDQRIWKWLCNRYGLRPDLTSNAFSFKDFLSLINADNPMAIEPHFRPQYLNLFWRHMRWDTAARLETGTEMTAFLSERGIAVETVDHHKTSAARRTGEFFDAETIDLTRQLYQHDFEYFGYAQDPGQVTPNGEIVKAECDDAIYEVIAKSGQPEICDSDTPLSKFRKTAQLGKRLKVVADHADDDLDYHTTCLFSQLAKQMRQRGKTNVLTTDQLAELDVVMEERKACAHQRQFGHLNQDFFVAGNA